VRDLSRVEHHQVDRVETLDAKRLDSPRHVDDNTTSAALQQLGTKSLLAARERSAARAGGSLMARLAT
jgi:hypothetical protein